MKCLVITPVGPKSKIENVVDTVNSFLFYMNKKDTGMLLLDDSGAGVIGDRFSAYDNIYVMSGDEVLSGSRKGHNTRGELFVKQIVALERIKEQFNWDVLLRLDDDALIIGPSPHLDAWKAFSLKPGVGMLGAYRRRGDGTNKDEALARQGRRIVRQVMSRSALRNPGMASLILKLVLKAKRNGYRLGHMCTGGAFFLTRDAYEASIDALGGKLLNLRASRLADDLIFSLACFAGGYSLDDFSDADHVMAINWRGLPMPLEELVNKKKKLVHPVKDPKNETHEKEVREFFSRRRVGGC